MTPATKTLAAIDAQLVATQESSHRAHLGASVIGRKCARELWYLFRWATEQKHEGQLLRLFNRGQREEERFVGWLRSIGCEVWETNPETGKQWRVSEVFGHFGGSLDGVARNLPDLPDGTPFLTEFKTHSATSFKKLLEMGVMGAKWEHFIQMQIYMHLMQLPVALYCAVNKDNDALHMELVKYDAEVAARAVERAKDIILSLTPPARVATSPGHFNCKYCCHNRLCHFGDAEPDRNCRTCRNSQPLQDGSGEWACLHMSQLDPEQGVVFGRLDEAAQRKGCTYYIVKPELQGVQP